MILVAARKDTKRLSRFKFAHANDASALATLFNFSRKSIGRQLIDLRPGQSSGLRLTQTFGCTTKKGEKKSRKLTKRQTRRIIDGPKRTKFRADANRPDIDYPAHIDRRDNLEHRGPLLIGAAGVVRLHRVPPTQHSGRKRKMVHCGGYIRRCSTRPTASTCSRY